MVFLIVGLSMQAAKETFKSSFKKEFDINRDALVEVSNAFGDVQCYNWDNNKVSIEVLVSVTAPDQKTADRVFDKISIDISGDKNMVRETTKISNIKERNVSFHVMVNIYLPETSNLNISNKFGNIFLENVKGKTILKQAFGELQATELQNDNNEIHVEHGSMRIGTITEAQINIKHSELSIEKAGNLRIDAGFTDMEIKDVKKLVVDANFGSLEIEDAGIVECNNKGAKITIEYLKGSIEATCEIGSLEIEEVARNFKEIDIEGHHTPISLGMESGSSFSLDLYTRFASVYLPSSFRMSKEKSDFQSYRYNGQIGEKSSTALVKIESEFGTVEIK